VQYIGGDDGGCMLAEAWGSWAAAKPVGYLQFGSERRAYLWVRTKVISLLARMCLVYLKLISKNQVHP
jgi:hypothetical protein